VGPGGKRTCWIRNEAHVSWENRTADRPAHSLVIVTTTKYEVTYIMDRLKDMAFGTGGTSIYGIGTLSVRWSDWQS
jgi:hypothetical protein